MQPKDNSKKIQAALDAAVQEALRKAADEIVRKAKDRVSEFSKSGDLERAIGRSDVDIDKDGNYGVTVHAKAKHAASIEYGSGEKQEPSDSILGLDIPEQSSGGRPYLIPRRNKDGTYQRPRQHTGVGPRPYIRPSIKDVLDNRFDKILDQELRTHMDAKGVRNDTSQSKPKPRVTRE